MISKKNNPPILTVIVLIALLKTSAVFAGDGVDTQIDDSTIVDIKLPTEIGVQGEIFFSYFGQNPLWYVGPGIFFDYKLNNDITLSANTFVSFQSFNNSQEQSIIVKPGLFIKHWFSSDWGFIGAGLEGIFHTGSSSADYFQLMLSAIITGENVRLKDQINSTGDLKVSVSLFNSNQNNSDIRFNIAYSLGIGFEISSKDNLLQDSIITK